MYYFASWTAFVFVMFAVLNGQANGGQSLFDKIVVFGDSQSDTGNVYRLTNGVWPSPPHYFGRFCNGPNWVDRLRQCEIKTYAYGSATTDNNLAQGITYPNDMLVPGMRQQIAIYLNSTVNSTINFARTLYIFWASINDLYFNASLTPPVIVNSLSNGIKDILAAGGRHILVFNQVPFQIFPYIRILNQSAYYIQFTAESLNALISSLAIIQQNNTDATINIFDINTLLTRVVANQESIQFTNTVDRCWDTDNGNNITILCSDPNQYVFMDNYHFTTGVHEIIANAIRPFRFSSFNISSQDYIRSV